jgi:WD40 repeat protein
MVAGSWSPDGRRLALCGDSDALIRLWDLHSRRQVGLLEGHKNLAVGAIFNPAGNLVASNSWEAMLRVWDPRTGRQLLSMPAYDQPRFNRRGDRILLQHQAPEIWEVADGREYRTFVGDPVRGKQVPYGGAISPDGRLLAAGSANGTVIWDLATGNELAHLPSGWTWAALFQPSGDLLTSGRDRGLLRWPIRPNPEVDGEYRIGPPEALLPNSTDRVAQSKDGRTVVVAVSEMGGQVLDLDQPGVRKPLLPHPGTNGASISPDGEWAATGCHHGTGIKVWSVRRNQRERELPIEGSAGAWFSPDGRWLATNSATGGQLWKVGTWERGPALPSGSPVFSPDGRLVGVTANYAVTLIDLATGRTVATLDDPNQDRPGAGCFSPDGAQLALGTEESYSIHIWDLRRIRAGLKAIDLDWDAPDYPPAASPRAPLRPFKVLGGQPGQPPPPPAPLVVVNVARSGSRRATAEQLAGWVKQLADKDTKTQTEAMRALEEVGAPALKALATATRHPDAAVRARVQQVRDRIAVAQAVTPRRFSLAWKDVPVADAVAALAKQAGVRLSYRPRPAAIGLLKTVTLKLEGVPFLEALDRLCQTAGLVAFRTGPDAWNLHDGLPTATELLAYAGPLRLQPANMHLQLDLQGAKQGREYLWLHLSLRSEARSAILSAAQPRAVEARDNAGRSLVPEFPGPDQPGRAFLNPINSQYDPMLTVLLQPPAARGATLKHLKIALPVEVMARRRDVLTVTDLLRAVGKTYAGAGGVRLKVQLVNQFGLNSLQVQLAVSAPVGQALDSRNLGLRLVSADGREHSPTFLNLNPFPQTVRELEGEDLLWLSGPVPGSLPSPLTLAAQEPMARTRQQWFGNAQFATPQPIAGTARLTLYRFDRLRTELTFDFRDLPLP